MIAFEQRGYNFIKEINKNKSTLVQSKNINGDIIGEEKNVIKKLVQ